ncbi:MAG: hypothetical protein GKC05_08345 [Methanomicrobiales archaeon]|nr:hypothetical protein [Methanomicrobiales archaeon]NYT20470.1 hypothetical protein [Methanomicrobiales archaeon]
MATHNASSAGKGAAILVILCFLGIMPVLVWVTLPETGPYPPVPTASVLVQTAAADAGLNICSSGLLEVDIPGAQHAELYQLSPDCRSPDPATTVQILIVGFTTTEARNEAIVRAQTTHLNWQATNTAAYMNGTVVMVIQGVPANQAVDELGTSLIGQGSVRII